MAQVQADATSTFCTLENSQVLWYEESPEMGPIARRLMIGARPVWLTFDEHSPHVLKTRHSAHGYTRTGLLRPLELGHILVCASVGVPALCAQTPP